MNLPRQAAEEYRAAGFEPVRLQPGEKRPSYAGWSSKPTPLDWFLTDSGVGLKPGWPSNGGCPGYNLVCVDGDALAALPVLAEELPPTGMVDGRPGKPDSHSWYLIPTDTIPPEEVAGCGAAVPSASVRAARALGVHPGPRKLCWKLPDGSVAFELLGAGQQAAVPPSRHTSGESREWKGGTRGDPAKVPYPELRAALERAAGRLGAVRTRKSGATDTEAAADKAAEPLNTHPTVQPWQFAEGGAAAEERYRGYLTTVRSEGDLPRDGKGGDAKTYRLLGAGLEMGVRPDRVLAVFKEEMNGYLAAVGTTTWDDAELQRKIDIHLAKGPDRARVTHFATTRPPGPRQPFPLETLPPAAADLARAGAESIGCPDEFIALPAISVLTGAVGAKYEVEVKKGWVEPCVTWTCVVAQSGCKKTPAFNLATAPARKIAAEQATDYKAKQKAYKAAHAAWKAAGKSADRGPEPAPPKLEKWLVSDATVEAIADRLENHPAGLLLARDEMDAWHKGMNQYKAGGGADRAAYLEMHSGGTINVDRKNAERPSIFVPRACVSMCGRIQPGIFESSFGEDDFASGLIPRFLLANLSGVSGVSGWSDVELGDSVTEGWEKLVRKVFSLPPCYSTPSCDADPVLIPRRVPICPTARQTFARHCDEMARRAAKATPEMRAALSKLEGAAARLALVLHIAAVDADTFGNVPPVSDEAMQAGVALAQWFAGEAVTLYGNRGAKQSLGFRRLAVCGVVSCRDLQRSNPRAFPNRDAAHQELAALVESGDAVWADPKCSKVAAKLSGTCPTAPDNARQCDG